MSAESKPSASDSGTASTAELIGMATSQISTLVRDELALARMELVDKGKRAGLAAGLFGGAAVLSVYGTGLLVVLAVVALGLVWPLWLAILTVTVALFVVAATAAVAGKRQFKAAAPPIPSQAAAGVARDIQVVKDAVREGRH